MASTSITPCLISLLILIFALHPGALSTTSEVTDVSEINLRKTTSVRRTFTEPTDVNAGPDVRIKRTKSLVYDGVVNTRSRRGLPRESFKTAREGRRFEIIFDLEPGTYDVLLGFAELKSKVCKPSARIFNVYINEKLRLASFDVFSTARECYRATTQRFTGETIDPVLKKPIVIRFEAIAGRALINHVKVRRSVDQCKPITDNPTVAADHLAHAVPGKYPPNSDTAYVDSTGKGFVSVNVDGRGSHTHFFAGTVPGRIRSYKWTLPDTGKLLSTKPNFRSNFGLGTTRVRLEVVDSVCSSDEAETSITVSGKMQQGLYCYYYQGLTELPMPGTLYDEPRPSFAAVSTSTNVKFPSFPFRDTKFAVRCIFFVNFPTATNNTQIFVGAGKSGFLRVYKGLDLLVDLATSRRSAPLAFTAGLHAFEVVYLRTKTRMPRMLIKFDGKFPTAVSYDQTTVLPIITSINPPDGPSAGGGRTKIEGYGLFLPLIATFGPRSVRASSLESTPTMAVVYPPASSANVVSVKVKNRAGFISNTLQYIYGSSCDPVAFSLTTMTTSTGGVLNLMSATSVVLWRSGVLYMGTRTGIIREVSYDFSTMRVTNLCSSLPLTDARYKRPNGTPSTRAILGITLDPRDTEPRPYVSASTLFWERSNEISASNRNRWSNGAVERFVKTGDTGTCLRRDRRIVGNLPVPDSDHSINELLFTQSGDLLIAIGGFTNGGLPYVRLGGEWEAYFSGAVVRARLSLGQSYNGVIQYDTPFNVRTAKPISGDVDLYATGFRNLFSMIMTRDGGIYGIDMGTNCGFGNMSSSCSQYVESEAARRDTEGIVPFPGNTLPDGPGAELECRYNADRKDKLVRIKEGKFYGHSNLQRALLTNQPGECIWIDPETGRSPSPQLATPPVNYEHNIGMFRSPMTGFREYGSNLFCGKMRGDFVFSRYKAQASFRIRKESSEKIDETLELLSATSGMRVEEDAHGSLIYPKFHEAGVHVLQPNVASRGGLFIVNAVPWRHGRNGGRILSVGGWGFESGAKVFVGSKPCEVKSLTAREIECVVPAFGSGSQLVDVKVEQGFIESTLPRAVLYMSV